MILEFLCYIYLFILCFLTFIILSLFFYQLSFCCCCCCSSFFIQCFTQGFANNFISCFLACHITQFCTLQFFFCQSHVHFISPGEGSGYAALTLKELFCAFDGIYLQSYLFLSIFKNSLECFLLHYKYQTNVSDNIKFHYKNISINNFKSHKVQLQI